MKPFSYIAAVLFLLYFSACKEVNTLPTSVGVDTTKTQQQQNVLIEDITGVRCVNCPQGNAIIDSLISTYSGRVEAIGIHSGMYSLPYQVYNDTFATAQSNALANYLDIGNPGTFPEGCVNQKLFNGQSAILIDRSLWAGLALQELLDTIKVNISVSNNYNSSTRSLGVTVTVNYLSTVTSPQKLNVVITESNIVSPQLTPDGLDSTYVHNHVFREALSNPTGDIITTPTIAGSQFSKTYSFTLPSEWNAKNCRVVAFVCDNGTDLNVIQVSGANVQ